MLTVPKYISDAIPLCDHLRKNITAGIRLISTELKTIVCPPHPEKSAFTITNQIDWKIVCRTNIWYRRYLWFALFLRVKCEIGRI